MEALNLKDALESLPDILQYGIIGVGALLLLLTAFLIYFLSKDRKVGVNTLIIGFMIFGIVVLTFGFFSVSTNPNKIVLTERAPGDTLTVVPAHPPGLEQKTADIRFYKEDELWDYVNANYTSIHEMYIGGAHLQNGIGKILEPLTKILQAGGRLNVVFTNYNDIVSIRQQADRDKLPDPEGLRKKIEKTIAQLEALRSVIPTAQLDVRVISWGMDERIHIINPQTPGSRIYVKLYPYKHQYLSGVDLGGLFFYTEKVSDRDPIYDYYHEKFVNYFRSASPYEPLANVQQVEDL